MQNITLRHQRKNDLRFDSHRSAASMSSISVTTHPLYDECKNNLIENNF